MNSYTMMPVTLSAKTFSEKVLAWYEAHGRTDLPWQKNRTAYRVWISEIMLQQTQVKTVIPYYLRFIKIFPTLKALALAPQDEVLQLWAGLGYYARARCLHQSAQIIYHHYKGRFPRCLERLQQLPGIGRSTAGAIAAMAMNIHAPILDGNVKRILCRFAAIPGWPGEQAVAKKLWTLATQLTPQSRVADYTQAMMDIGALICTKKQPQCTVCPLQSYCVAYQTKQQLLFPQPKPAKNLPIRTTQMLLLLNQENHIFLVKRPSSGIWGGLWSLPEYDLRVDVLNDWQNRLSFPIQPLAKWSCFRHTFTHFHLDITPILLKVTSDLPKSLDDELFASSPVSYLNLPGAWFNIEKALQQGIPAPTKRLLRQLQHETLSRNL